jgi:iron complex transport system ATP-binding protein
MIKLTNIHFRRENNHILKDVNLHMNDGEQWIMLGRNGSGKTTLLELMTGYQFPSSGSVEVLGYKYGSVDLREVRKEIGYIGQTLLEKMNLSDPVWEAVATGEYAFLRFYQEIPEEVKEKAKKFLETLDIVDLWDRPLGVISQGERKKVLLARSMMSSPKLLILDEPCAGLDLFEREKLLKGIDQFARQGVQMVYVTHHLEEIIPMFTHVALIEGGQLVAAGPKHEVLTNELLERTFDVKLQVEWFEDRPWARVY